MGEKYIKLPLFSYFILEIITFSPIIIVIIFFGVLSQPIWTMIFFQLITLTFLPFYFIDVLLINNENYDVRFEDFYPKLLINLRGQMIRGLALTLLIFISVGVFYCLLFHFFSELFLSIQIPISATNSNYIAITLLLGFSNPWLEEWFWRVFLIKFYPNTEFWRLYTTFHYASYHWFVLFFLTKDWGLSFLGFVGIFFMGRLFLFLRMNAGFLAGGVTHMASDISVVIILFIVLNYQK